MILPAVLVVMALLAGAMLARTQEPVPATREACEREMSQNNSCIIVVSVLAVVALAMILAGMGAG